MDDSTRGAVAPATIHDSVDPSLTENEEGPETARDLYPEPGIALRPDGRILVEASSLPPAALEGRQVCAYVLLAEDESFDVIDKAYEGALDGVSRIMWGLVLKARKSLEAPAGGPSPDGVPPSHPRAIP